MLIAAPEDVNATISTEKGVPANLVNSALLETAAPCSTAFNDEITVVALTLTEAILLSVPGSKLSDVILAVFICVPLATAARMTNETVAPLATFPKSQMPFAGSYVPVAV